MNAELIHVPHLVNLICAEYREMPGLCLTRRQFHRLWGLDDETGDVLLETLVAAEILKRTPRDSYVLAEAML